MKKRLLLILIAVSARHRVAGGLLPNAPVPTQRPSSRPPPSSRGDVVDTVEATGTLAGGDDGPGRHAGLRHHPVAARRLQLRRSARARSSPGSIRRCCRRRSIRREATIVRLQADVERARVGARRRAGQAAAGAASCSRQQTDSRHRPRERRDRPRAGGGVAQGGAGAGDAGARVAQPEPGQPEPHDHHRAGRRHRHLAQRGRRADGGGEHVGADAVRHREGPHRDAGQRQHRRSRTSAASSRARP